MLPHDAFRPPPPPLRNSGSPSSEFIDVMKQAKSKRSLSVQRQLLNDAQRPTVRGRRFSSSLAQIRGKQEPPSNGTEIQSNAEYYSARHNYPVLQQQQKTKPSVRYVTPYISHNYPVLQDDNPPANTRHAGHVQPKRHVPSKRHIPAKRKVNNESKKQITKDLKTLQRRVQDLENPQWSKNIEDNGGTTGTETEASGEYHPELTVQSPQNSNVPVGETQYSLPPTAQAQSHGYRALTEDELVMIDHLENREKELRRHIKKNHEIMENGVQLFRTTKQVMKKRMEDLISLMNHEMECKEQALFDHLGQVLQQVQEETKKITESLTRSRSLQQQIRKGIDQPIHGAQDLKQRSATLMQSTKEVLRDEKAMKFVQEIQIPDNVDWESVLKKFSYQITNQMEVSAQFGNIELLPMPFVEESGAILDKSAAIFAKSAGERSHHSLRRRSPLHVDIDRDQPSSRDVLRSTRSTRSKASAQFSPTALGSTRNGNQIEFSIMGITKGTDIHVLHLNADIKGRVSVNKSLWEVAPVSSPNRIRRSNHETKYPTTVYHPRRNEIYRFGGVLDGEQLNHADKYNIGLNQWSKVMPSNIARQDALSLLLNDSNIIVMGGAAKAKSNSSRSGWKVYDNVSIYNLESNSWRSVHISDRKLASMKQPRYGFAGVSIVGENKVVVFGGSGPNGRSSRTSMFDYSANRWKYLSDIPVVKSRHSAVLHQDRVIVAGGDHKSESRKCFVFDLSRNEWSSMPPLNQNRMNPVLLSTLDKSCVIAAGHGHELKSFEVLDGRTRQQRWMMTTIRDHPMGAVFKAGMIALK